MSKLNLHKMSCIQQTMKDLGVSMTFKQMNVLLGAASNQGFTISELAREMGLSYGQVHQILERLGTSREYRNGYKIQGLGLVQKVRGRRPYTRKGFRYVYLTPKGLAFVKRITRNKR